MRVGRGRRAVTTPHDLSIAMLKHVVIYNGYALQIWISLTTSNSTAHPYSSPGHAHWWTWGTEGERKAYDTTYYHSALHPNPLFTFARVFEPFTNPDTPYKRGSESPLSLGLDMYGNRGKWGVHHASQCHHVLNHASYYVVSIINVFRSVHMWEGKYNEYLTSPPLPMG